ncbi:MAG: hypothetical protein LAN61_15975 [Acidobacteriia bacterium]|nr:hypothetical protein [Terriglobia bacterium]
MGVLTSLSKSTTSTWLGVSEILLLLFGVLLVIGLVGEYRENLKRWVKVFEMFVIIGVAGELLADGGIFALSRHLETIANGEIAALTQQAAVANQHAAKANDRAAQGEALAKGFEAQIASAGNSAAQANQKAESERLARARLENKMKPRHLTTEQQAKLARILGDEPNPISIYSQMLDSESGDYADDFTVAFKSAKWQTFGPNRSRMTRDQGIEIGTLAPGTPAAKRMVERIQKAFGEVNVTARVTYFSGDDQRMAGRFENNVLYLIIDHKEDVVPTDVRK